MEGSGDNATLRLPVKYPLRSLIFDAGKSKHKVLKYMTP
jgi:hypothetical protein